MPRPGPRPYECVRRAWHSERHQPIRGSLIKEIFRVANEIHGSSTKQNKEWQEKLPIVVLKAEEIMYSKANSEAEYMDLKTLWDRTNDAINTIIRRDESSETGEFLQPCIEAALNLGCTPRRASRSQRNCHPRCYLSPNTTDLSPSMVENSVNGSSFARPSNQLSSDPRNLVAQNSISPSIKFASMTENVPPANYEQLLAMSNYAAPNSFSVFPLYYGSFPQFEQLQPGCGLPPKLVSDDLEPAKGGTISSLPDHVDASKKNVEPNIREVAEKTCKIGCDLSLRLGPLSVALPSAENKQPQDVKDVCSQEGGKFNNQSPILDKGFPLFPRDNAYEALGSYKSVEATMRKRKAVFDHPVMEDQQFCLQPKLPFSYLSGL